MNEDVKSKFSEPDRVLDKACDLIKRDSTPLPDNYLYEVLHFLIQ